MDMTLLFLSQIAVSDLNVVKFQGVDPQGLYGDLNCLYIPDFK
mgnify:CR=1 FL=1